MIVTCPNCETKFNVPDDAYIPGRKARCSSCGHVFPLPELPAEKADAPASSVLVQGEQKSEESPEVLSALETSGMFDPDTLLKVDSAPAKKGGKRRIVLLVAILVLLGICAGSGYFIYSFLRPKAPEKVLTEEEKRLELVKNLALAEMRQFVVTDNEKTGYMVVVEGKVINHFETPKELIQLEISLYDKDGAVLATRRQYAGINFSLFQLQVLGRAELEAGLKNQVEILMNNTNIPPGGEVHFSTIFFDPPEATYEYGVRIVDVKAPPPPKK